MHEMLQKMTALQGVDQYDNFMILCKIVIDGRKNSFTTENSVACLMVDGVPWMLRGRKIPQGTIYEFID